ncbi:MAG: adenylosuccinate synthase, partial [Planctomycetales bacterium]|nr:adenylosuccinate synthase [Planctomycetales bacterium]NIM07770.1 adenylosuccinate synthase [Planctomycetales bacterium]NIN07264.1 adenylosuccinate synthase [Planctomycetales bacterium]NIN76356.1 adenylosuccinate synthase [Planctomycetales bacterium]NIO33565.1 adenylosuccinate synthase [Planctomycetales bacterium]
MPGTCVIGLQWGDEAKGKLVDLLTLQHEIVVRYQGGTNAGHTVVIGDQTYKLSLIPSGILTPSVRCVIAGGVVVNPRALLDELDGLAGRGVSVGDQLLVSDRAHVIFPWHIAEDRALNESTADGENIGTTQRGIGPCYRDKVGRSHALRLGDLLQPTLKQRIEHIVSIKERTLASLNGSAGEPLNAEQIYQEYRGYAQRMEPYLTDTTTYLLDAVEAGRKVLFEGAQGSLLDIDHGTFPFVTSSNSSGVGVSCGSGVPARYIQRVIGVIKAYSTRVGGGPFPTEQENETGQRLRDRGNEYGTVTRRPRRCGWFDAVAVRYAARISGVDELAVMLLDVLSESLELKICTAYEIDGKRTTNFPSHVDQLRRAVPVYETVPGWQENISGVRTLEDLPDAARNYLGRLSELIGRPVTFVSVGPERSQTIV